MTGKQTVTTRCEIRSNYVGISTPFGNINIYDLVSCLYDKAENQFSLTWNVVQDEGNTTVTKEDVVFGETFEEVFLRYIARRLVQERKKNKCLLYGK